MTVAVNMSYTASFKSSWEQKAQSLINFDFINEDLIKKIFWHALGDSIKVWQEHLLFCVRVIKPEFLFEISDKDVKVLFWGSFLPWKSYFRKQLLKSKSIFSSKSTEVK